MNKKYYIQLLDENAKSFKWYFENIDKRNEAYNLIRNRFKNETHNQIPWIEINLGDEINLGLTISIPLKLKSEIKEEVKIYINSLNEQ